MSNEQLKQLTEREYEHGFVTEIEEDRSNIVLAPSPDLPDFLLGDDFRLPGNDHYKVTTIRVWAVGGDGTSMADASAELENLILWGGLDNKPIAQIAENPIVTVAQYSDLQPIYIGTLGGQYLLYKVDFTVNLRIKGGKLFDFFVENEDDTPYLHASNAGKSGNVQQGADDTILFLGPEGDIFTYQTSEGTRPTWDKDSDVNVQVFGTSDKKASKSK